MCMSSACGHALQISCCTALTCLEISSVTLPEGILRIASLRHLTLDQCRPTAEQLRNISSLTSLAKLRMCNSRDGWLDIPLGSLWVHSTLTVLQLDQDGLTALPPLQSAPWLTQLQHLNLQANRCAWMLLLESCVHLFACLLRLPVLDLPQSTLG